MAKTKALLTPISDTMPVVVDVPGREPSGALWVSRFPGSCEVADCDSPFKDGLSAFIAAMVAAGAKVRISATYRPAERAYLMHWAWKIWKGLADPQKVPAKSGVHIKWDHTDSAGHYDKKKSVDAAAAMVNGYDISDLGVAPALESQHTLRLAVDMSISWSGALTIQDKAGQSIVIKSAPSSGMNKDLHAVGASYGVIKYNARGTDKPHWSSNGK